MRAMILAAGLGTRLRPITYGMPKPMVPVLNRPVMEHIARLLARHGFGEAIANLHWFPDLIRGALRRWLLLRDRALLQSRGATPRHLGRRSECGRLSRRLLPRHLRRRPHRYRPRGDARFHESHDGIATLATKRVADTSQFGVAITDGDGRIQGFQEKPDPAEALSDLANCGIYMFRSEVFDFFPAAGASKAAGPGDPPGFADWAMDVFPALLEADVPFYSHEIEAYWNDIGNLDELRSGNLDALHGAVELDPGAPAVADGIWAASPLDGIEATAPLMVGRDVELGEGVRIEGPAILADGCRVGDGACIRDSIVLAGAELPPKAILVGGIAARLQEA